MVNLLRSKLNAIEASLYKIEEACNLLDCGNFLERVSIVLTDLETEITSGSQEVFNRIEELIEKLNLISSYLSLRSSIIKVLMLSSGVVLLVFSGFAMLNVSNILLMSLAIISAILSLSGMLLYKYSTGQIFMILSAIFLAMSPHIINAIIASISAFLVSFTVVMRKSTKEKLKGAKI